ncbi:hypothetical protein K6025_04370 [Ehrlichia sp. JZT12]
MDRKKIDTKNLHIKLKNSLLCGLKGWLIFNLANITLLYNSTHSKFFGKDSKFSLSENNADYKISHNNIKHQIKNNVIPFLEVITVMPTVFTVSHFIGKYVFHDQYNQTTMLIICGTVCALMMITICLTLRLTGIRKDCCSSIVHPIYRNPKCKDNSFINFTDPNNNQEHSSKSNGNTFPLKLKNIFNKKTNKYPGKAVAKAMFFAILMTPITIIRTVLELTLFTIETIELPFSLIFDILTMAYEIAKYGNTKSQFDHSRQNVEKMTSLLYAGLRDLIVASSLGILGADIIIQKNNSLKSPISYLDKTFTKSHIEEIEKIEETTEQKHCCCAKST